MDAELTNPGNPGESSSWAESQALEVREACQFIYFLVFATLLMVGYQLFHQFADGRHLGTFRIAGKC